MSTFKNTPKTPRNGKGRKQKNHHGPQVLPNGRGENGAQSSPASPGGGNFFGNRRRSVMKDTVPEEIAGPKTPDPAHGYAQRQEDELEVIKSIYGDSVELIEKRGAWNKHVIAFNLNLRANNDLIVCSLTLFIEFTATYPATSPIIEIKNCKGLLPAERTAVENIIKEATKRKGEEVIYDIASAIEAELQDIVFRQERERDVSLLNTHELAIKEAQEQALKEEEKKRLEEKRAVEEEELAIKSGLNKEQKKKAEMGKSKRPSVSFQPEETIASPEVVVAFERAVKYSEDGEDLEFKKCVPISKISEKTAQAEKSSRTVYSVRPVIGGSTANNHVLALKILTLPDVHDNPEDGKAKIRKLEAQLDALRAIKHTNVANVLESTVSSVSGPPLTWQISMICEFGNRGTLKDTLQMVDNLTAKVTKSWVLMILDGLEYLHTTVGVAHGRLHPGNILIVSRPRGGSNTIKLVDCGYESLIERFPPDGSPPALSSPYKDDWCAPEQGKAIISGNLQKGTTTKTDIWNLGVVILQMLFGLNVVEQFTSPQHLLERIPLTQSLNELLLDTFRPSSKDRPRSFNLISYEWFRNNEQATDEDTHQKSHRHSVSGSKGKPRRESVVGFQEPVSQSRFESDWFELGRLGKGGFGEVVKVRNRYDNQVYAIKKIKNTSRSSMRSVLSEVALLCKLNHPNVVRYFQAWFESTSGTTIEEIDEDAIESDDDEDESDSEDDDDDGYSGPDIVFATDTPGLDIAASRSVPGIEFGISSDEEGDYFNKGGTITETGSEDDEDEDEEYESESDESRGIREVSTHGHNHADNADSVEEQSLVPKPIYRPRKQPSTLYIQMELCERKTLRDLIGQKAFLDSEKRWEMLRRVVSGLRHIHEEGIIHRDFKPENVFIDAHGNPKIGDFGLATSGKGLRTRGMTNSTGGADSDLTTDVGTAMYVAPELSGANGKGSYDSKVDIYSLGIVFFEMCYPLSTGMERHQVLNKVRAPEILFPSGFENEDNAKEVGLLRLLLTHDPEGRPTSKELLGTGHIPYSGDEEAMDRALLELRNGGQYFDKAVAALFSRQNDRQLEFAYNMDVMDNLQPTQDYYLIRTMVRNRFTSVFRKHGAVETFHQTLFPKSSIYPHKVVEVVDTKGNILQLPYDSVLANARMLARTQMTISKAFTFGRSYRPPMTPSDPVRGVMEVSFDIVSEDSADLALQEAEAIKVLAEAMDSFPFINPSKVAFHINHGALLDIIFDYVNVTLSSQRDMAKEYLSRLHTERYNWDSLASELRQLGLQSTCIDDLRKFDWRNVDEVAIAHLKRDFSNSPAEEKCIPIFAHITTVLGYLRKLGMHHKVYINPLGTYAHAFYKNGLMFQMVLEGPGTTRDVLGAGGRYDELIKDLKPGITRGEERKEVHAVGFAMPLLKIYGMAVNYGKSIQKVSQKKGDMSQSSLSTKRVDVIVASFSKETLRNQGLLILRELWDAGISAELAPDFSTQEHLIKHYRNTGVQWIVTVKTNFKDSTLVESHIRLRRLFRSDKDAEEHLQHSALITTIREELRKRELEANQLDKKKAKTVHRRAEDWSRADVTVVLPELKKTARRPGKQASIRDSAIQRAGDLATAVSSAPVIAVDLTPETFDQLRCVSLRDSDSWKRFINSVQPTEKSYLGSVKEELLNNQERGKKMVVLVNNRNGETGVFNI